MPSRANCVAKQPLRIQYLDGVVALGPFDHAIQEMRIDRPGSGIVLLDLVRGKQQKVVDPIDHKPDRRRHDRSRSPVSPRPEGRPEARAGVSG